MADLALARRHGGIWCSVVSCYRTVMGSLFVQRRGETDQIAAKNDSWWIILSYRFGRGSRRRSHGFVNQSQSNIDGVLPMSLRRLSLPAFRPHLQAKVSHITLRHTPPFTLTTTRVGIDASSLSDAASCPNLRARRSPHSISYYKLQIVRYCFPGLPTSAP